MPIPSARRVHRRRARAAHGAASPLEWRGRREAVDSRTAVGSSWILWWFEPGSRAFGAGDSGKAFLARGDASLPAGLGEAIILRDQAILARPHLGRELAHDVCAPADSRQAAAALVIVGKQPELRRGKHARKPQAQHRARDFFMAQVASVFAAR